MARKKHIDDVQPSLEEHFRSLLEDESIIDNDARDRTPEDLPEWFDEKLFKLGQAYYLKNLLSIGVSNLVGLISIISVPETLEILKFTDQSSTPCAAFRRYSQTMLHMHALAMGDPTDAASEWYKSLNVIRWKHVVTNKRSRTSGLTGILQRDMALTQFGFIGYVLLCPEETALTNEPESREAYNHLWRVLGHMLGISDRINICRKTEGQTTELCGRISKEILWKHLEAAPPVFFDLTKAVLDGMWHADVTLDADAFMALTYNMTGLEYKKPLRLYSWLNMKYREYVLYACSVPYLGSVVRLYFRNFLLFSYWLLKNYPIGAWMSFGKANSRLKLYPKLR